MAANNNNKQQQLPPQQQLFLKFWGGDDLDKLINKQSIGQNMGRTRKPPARIMTANLPLTTWDEMDALRLRNRSVWLNRVILDEIERENTNRDLYEERVAASKKEMEIMNNPAQYLDQVSDRQLLAAALSRIPEEKKQLRNNLIKMIQEMVQ